MLVFLAKGFVQYILEQIRAKKNKLPARKKIALELLHQRLGQRSTRSFLAGNAANFWEDVDLRIGINNQQTIFENGVIGDAYSQILKLYGTENITTAEVMDK